MSDKNSIPDLAAAGLAAGLTGTCVMTLGQMAEISARRRNHSTTPAKAVEKVTGVELADEKDKKKASNYIHFAYGTGLGLGLALLDRVKEPLRSVLFGAGVWSLGVAMLRSLRLAPPLRDQKPAEVATDIGHHIVYAAASGAAYSAVRELAGAKGGSRKES